MVTVLNCIHVTGLTVRLIHRHGFVSSESYLKRNSVNSNEKLSESLYSCKGKELFYLILTTEDHDKPRTISRVYRKSVLCSLKSYFGFILMTYFMVLRVTPSHYKTEYNTGIVLEHY